MFMCIVPAFKEGSVTRREESCYFTQKAFPVKVRVDHLFYGKTDIGGGLYTIDYFSVSEFFNLSSR